MEYTACRRYADITRLGFAAGRQIDRRIEAIEYSLCRNGQMTKGSSRADKNALLEHS